MPVPRRVLYSSPVMGLTGIITAPYGAIEAWIYDVFFAPAALAMVERAGVRPWESLADGATLLDVGCGGGHLLRHIRQARADLRLTGVDLSDPQIRRARSRLGSNARRLSLLQANVLDLPLVDESFDAVVSVGSIKHWSDRAMGLASCVRVLRTGGPLLVLDFDKETDDATLDAFVRRWRPPPFVRPKVLASIRRKLIEQALSVSELQDLASTTPLVDVEVRRVEGTPALMLTGKRG